MNTLLSRILLTLSLALLSVAPLRAAPDIPTLTGRVVDTAGMLSAQTAADIEQKLAAHEQSTSNQIVVLTVPNLQNTSIASFSLEVARAWGLGTKELNNGVLFLLAQDERKIRIEVGYGLEGDLPDALAKRIIQGVVRPKLRSGDNDGGISAGAEAIIGTIEGTYTPPETGNAIANSPFVPMGLVGLFGFAAFMKPRVKRDQRKYVDGAIGGSFAGAMVSIATGSLLFGIPAALAFGYFLVKSNKGGGGGGSSHGHRRDGFSHHGGFGGSGGGFRGGGGGFGGGGASGGW